MQEGFNELRQKKAESIERARQDALDISSLLRMQQNIDDATAAFLRGEITGAQCDAVESAEHSEAGVARARGLIEFRELLRSCGMPEDEVSETIAHENAHMGEALALGVDPVYMIRFVTMDDEGHSKVLLQPSVHFSFPEDMSDDERRRILHSIIEAPDDLSDSDRRQLE